MPKDSRTKEEMNPDAWLLGGESAGGAGIVEGLAFTPAGWERDGKPAFGSDRKEK